jgi:predicted amino acid racemase
MPGLNTETFVLESEIIELKKKPSTPDGIIAEDAFGKVPFFEDKGERLRVWCLILLNKNKK